MGWGDVEHEKVKVIQHIGVPSAEDGCPLNTNGISERDFHTLCDHGRVRLRVDKRPHPV